MTFPSLFDGLELLHARYVTHRLAPHRSPRLTIALVQEGEWLINLSGRTQVAGPGSILLVGPEQVHDGGPADSGGCELRTFSIGSPLLEELAGRGALRPGRRVSPSEQVLEEPTLSEELAGLHERLEEDEVSEGLKREFRRRFRGLLAEAGAIGTTREIQDEMHEGTRRAIDFIQMEYGDRIGLDAMAGIAGLSRFHFIRVFQQDTGLTPCAFLTQVRLEAARESIRSGGRLAEVAVGCGFSDQSHLTRHFKRYYGFTPGQLARACRHA